MRKAIIFDMDGVLIDSFYAWQKTVEMAAMHFNKQKVTPDIFKSVFGQGTIKDIELFMPGHSVEEVEEFYNENFPKFIKDTKLMPNAKETLIELKSKGVKLAVATNTNNGLAQKQLEIVGIKQFFDVIVGGDDVENSKPAPDLINKAIQLLNVKEDEVLYVGDTVFDVEAASDAKVFMVGFRIRGDAKINDIDEIMKYIG